MFFSPNDIAGIYLIKAQCQCCHSRRKKMIITILLLSIVCKFTALADSPNWLGTFNVDESCDQNECCCLVEQATITAATDNQLLVSANVGGVPCHDQLNGSTTITALLPQPTAQSGYQISTNFLGTYNRFTLSSDSEYVAHVNLQYPKCSGMARRVLSNWMGTFQLDNSCDQTQCCCLVEEAKISKFNDSQLLVAANIAGTTCPHHSSTPVPVEIPLDMPKDKHGFQLTTFFVGSINRFTLTYDSQFISNANLQSPQCSGMARRINS